MAAYGHEAGDEGVGSVRHARTRKNTTFASLELPGGGQAYAPSPDAGRPGLAQAAPQAAITQATAQQATAGDPAARPQDGTINNDPPETKPTRKARAKHRVAKAAPGKVTRTATVQKAEDGADAPAAAQP